MTTHIDIQNALRENPTVTVPDTRSFIRQEPVVLPAHVPSTHARFEYKPTLQFATSKPPETVELRDKSHSISQIKITPESNPLTTTFNSHFDCRTNYLLRTLINPPTKNTMFSLEETALVETYDTLYEFYLDFATDDLPDSLSRELITETSSKLAEKYKTDDNTYYHTTFTCPACDHTQKLMHIVEPGTALHRTCTKLAPYLYCANCPNNTIPKTHTLTPTETHTTD